MARRLLLPSALALSALLLGATQAPRAWGYAIEVHKDFWDLAFPADQGTRQVPPPAQDDLAAFRRFVWERGAAQSEAFRRRWPSAESFDAAAFKELLALNPGKTVVGIDVLPAGRPTDLRTVVREGSVDPDHDDRNQDRLWVVDGQVQLDPFGRAVPYDPRTVWFGGLTGVPSQFDAHGATLRTGKKGGGAWTALRHPEQFARPPVPLGSAPEFSQTYTDLAMLAQLRGGSGSEWLARTFGGNNMHGLQDLGNQIHCTVLGAREFLFDGYKTHWLNKLKSPFKQKVDPAEGFGPPTALTTAQVNAAMALIKAGREEEVDPSVRFALGKEPKGAPDLTELGILIIGNHHRLLEDYVESQTIQAMRDLAAGHPERVPPHVRAVLERARRGDAEFEARCRAALSAAGVGRDPQGTAEFARVLAEVMIEHSAPEAAPIYQAIRRISRPELKKGGTYDGQLGHRPLDYVTRTEGPDVDRIWDLSGRAFARVVTILRLWEETFQAEAGGVTPGSPQALARADRIVERLVGRQLAYLDAAQQRREEYLAEKGAEFRHEREPASGFLERLKGAFFR